MTERVKRKLRETLRICTIHIISEPNNNIKHKENIHCERKSFIITCINFTLCDHVPAHLRCQEEMENPFASLHVDNMTT